MAKSELKLIRDEQTFFDAVFQAAKILKPDRYDLIESTARDAAIQQIAGDDFNENMGLYGISSRRYSQMLIRAIELSTGYKDQNRFHLLPPDVRKLSCRAAKAIQDYTQKTLELITVDDVEWENLTRLDLHVLWKAVDNYNQSHDSRTYPLSTKTLFKSLLDPEAVIEEAYGEFFNVWPLQARVVAGLAESVATAIPGKPWQLEDYYADLIGVPQNKTPRVRL